MAGPVGCTELRFSLILIEASGKVNCANHVYNTDTFLPLTLSMAPVILVEMAVNDDLVYQHVGSRVRTRRTHLGLSQGELADRVNLQRTSITNLEKGRQKIPLHVLYNVAEALDVDINTLLPSRAEVTTQDVVTFHYDDEELTITPLTANALKRAFGLLEGTDEHKD